MVTIEFGKAEKQTLDSNSLFLKFYGRDFKENVELIKSFWNRIYLKDTYEWEVPYSCFKEIQQLYSNTYIKYLNNPPKARVVTNDEILDGLDFNGFNLYDYQLEGVRFGLNHHNFLLLDEQGLGKTLQIITLARYKRVHRGLKHCLIICGLNSLKYNWAKEIKKFCNDADSIILGEKSYVGKNGVQKTKTLKVEETKEQIDKCPSEFFWIINVEKIRVKGTKESKGKEVVDYFNKQIECGNLGMVVVDEIHRAKSTKSQTAKGLLGFSNKADRIGMTGTLLVNNPNDLYSPMMFTGLINYSKWWFDKKYVIKDDWGQPVGYQNMGELHEILYKSSIRRTKDLLDLPEKILIPEWLQQTNAESEVLDAVVNGDPDGLLDKIEPIYEVVSAITRMKQTCVLPSLISSHTNKSTKFDRLKEILEDAKTEGKKVLVFCQYSKALKEGIEYCKEFNPKLIVGGMGSDVQKVIDEHEATNGFSVIFAQEATLGAGFTLINTEICVFLTIPWNRATFDQCCDRIHRIGQKHTVMIYMLLIQGTYDEIIYKNLNGKGAMSDALIDGVDYAKVLKELDKMGIYFKLDKKPIEGKLI